MEKKIAIKVAWLTAILFAAGAVGGSLCASGAVLPDEIIDPLTISQFVSPLAVLPERPVTREDAFHYPELTIEASVTRAVKYLEAPIVIQDQSFNSDGSLSDAPSPSFLDDHENPGSGDSTVASADVFGSVIVVNGEAWPYLEVEPRKYRLSFLNGSRSRYLILAFDEADIKFTVRGKSGGVLPVHAVVDRILMSPGEGFDVVVDFSMLLPGDNALLGNLGPDVPYEGLPIEPGEQAAPETTGKVMMFKVVPPTGVDRIVTPATLRGSMTRGTTDDTGLLSIGEEESALICVDANNVAVLCASLAPIVIGPGEANPLIGFSVPKAWADLLSTAAGDEREAKTSAAQRRRHSEIL